MIHTNPTDIFLWHELAILLLIFALFGVVLALLLIFRPRLVERINRVANRWVSSRPVSLLLDRSISIERWLHQHHRVVGIAIVLGSAYMLTYFGFLFDKAYTLQRWSGMLPSQLLEVLLNAMVVAALVAGAASLIVGLFFWLRPSLLRGMEDEANQWVSSRRATKVLDEPHGQVDRFVAHHAQRVGWLLLLGSIYLFFVTFRWLV
jgi:hypothetical protein